MFEIKGTPRPPAWFAGLVPEKVLYEFDGPRIFTTHAEARQFLLAYLCDEDANCRRFVVVPSNDMILVRLESGRYSVREALSGSWSWIVDVSHSGEVTAAWQVGLHDLPDDALPRPGILLLPTMRTRARRLHFPRYTTVECSP